MSGPTDFLRGLAGLSAFTDEQLGFLAGLLKPRRFKAGAVVYEEGTPADACYIVSSGRLRLELTRSNKTHRLAELGAGGLFGHVEMIDGGKRSARCVAAVDTSCLALLSATYQGILDDGKPIAFGLLDLFTGVLAGQLRQANTGMTALATGESKSASPRPLTHPNVQASLRSVVAQADAADLSRAPS